MCQAWVKYGLIHVRRYVMWQIRLLPECIAASFIITRTASKVHIQISNCFLCRIISQNYICGSPQVTAFFDSLKFFVSRPKIQILYFLQFYFDSCTYKHSWSFRNILLRMYVICPFKIPATNTSYIQLYHSLFLSFPYFSFRLHNYNFFAENVYLFTLWHVHNHTAQLISNLMLCVKTRDSFPRIFYCHFIFYRLYRYIPCSHVS